VKRGLSQDLSCFLFFTRWTDAIAESHNDSFRDIRGSFSLPARIPASLVEMGSSLSSFIFFKRTSGLPPAKGGSDFGGSIPTAQLEAGNLFPSSLYRTLISDMVARVDASGRDRCRSVDYFSDDGS